MAKKSAKRKKPGTPDGKVRVEVRLERELYERLEALAESAGIAVQQLLHGLAEWSADHAHPGEAYRSPGERAVLMRERKGCVFLGRPMRIEYEWEVEEDVWLQIDDARKWVEARPNPASMSILNELERRVVDRNDGIMYGQLDFSPRLARGGD